MSNNSESRLAARVYLGMCKRYLSRDTYYASKLLQRGLPPDECRARLS
jgi:hypothetical protein